MPVPTLQTKGATASNSSFTDSGAAGLGNVTMPATERPLKISMVFDDAVSARAAETLIRRAVLDFEYNLRSFAFADLDPSGPGVTAARSVFDTDILIVAVCEDQDLPDYMQFWLGLCLGLREQDQEGLLIVLIVKTAETADPDSSLLDYLRTVAAIGKMEFISHPRNSWRVPASNLAPNGK